MKQKLLKKDRVKLGRPSNVPYGPKINHRKFPKKNKNL